MKLKEKIIVSLKFVCIKIRCKDGVKLEFGVKLKSHKLKSIIIQKHTNLAYISNDFI